MSDRVAIVTGAGSGIGRESALALLRAGYAVTLAGRRAERLDETVKAAGEAGSRALAVPTDVADPESIRALFAKTKERFGRLDVLFNNAGTGAPPIPLEDLTYEQWKTVVDINLTGAFVCTQEAFKMMKSQDPKGGRIINNTSTKHAMTGLTKATSLDGRKYDIACGQIDIGNAATEMTQRMQGGALQAHGETMVEPTMNAAHVADAVVYMAGLPLDANVLFLTVMATKMPFVGRG